MAIEFAGWLYNNAGTAISGATVELFDRNTTTTSSESTTTSSTGYWSMTESTEGRYDVRITSGSSVRFIKYDTSMQFQEMEAHEVHFRGPDNAFTTDLVGSNVAANRVLTIPLITGSDTLATLGLAATFSAIMTHSADIIMQDGVDLALGTGSDGLFRLSAANTTGTAEDIVIALSNSSQHLHVTDVGAVATDWALANTTHPNVYIHSNTTPVNDYLRLGDHDGTTADIDVVGGTTLALQIAGTTEVNITGNGIEAENAAGPAFVNEAATTTNPTLVPDKAELDTGIGWASDTLHFILGGSSGANLTGTALTVGGDVSVGDDLLFASGAVANWNSGDITLTHSAGTLTYGGDGAVVIAHGANVDLSFTGSSGTNDIKLTDSLADALSIVRGTTDMVVFDSNTPRITITPTVTITGLLSVDDTTESTSTTTGSIHTDGGLGIVGDFYAGDDVFLTSGAVFNWNSGDVTLTHASGKLTFGGDGAVELDFNNHEMTNVDIDGGAIDGTAIGAASHSTVKGTTIDATTDFTIGSTVITDGVLTDASGFQMAAVLDMNNKAINNIGAAGHDFGASGLILADDGAYLGWQDTTNAGVQGAGEVGGSVSVANDETFTFTMGGDGCVFQLIQRTGGAANAGVGGLFFATYENATIIELADPTSKYVVGDSDAGDNWAVFKDAATNVVSVKNYRNATRGMSVVVLGSVASATAPA